MKNAAPELKAILKMELTKAEKALNQIVLLKGNFNDLYWERTKGAQVNVDAWRLVDIEVYLVKAATQIKAQLYDLEHEEPKEGEA